MKEEFEEFEKLCKPLIKYLNDNHHPYTTINITHTSGEVLEWQMCCHTTEFVKG